MAAIGASWLFSLAGAVPARSDPALALPTPASTVVFTSLEAGPAKLFASSGVKAAAFGTLDRAGARVFAKAGLALERANPLPPRGYAGKAEAQALLGHEWRLGDSFLALYGGFDYEGEVRISPVEASARDRVGLRLQAELWATPSRETMLQAGAYVSTLDRRLWGRLAFGFALPFSGYAGPEIEHYRQARYSKLRLGLQLAEMKLLGAVWRLSAGWQRASRERSGAYASLGMYWLR